MSVKKCMGKTAAALCESRTKMVKLYDFLRGLSIKNKASFDIQLKSDKSFVPICHRGFSYNKEFRVMPIVFGVVGVAAMCTALKAVFHKD